MYFEVIIINKYYKTENQKKKRFKFQNLHLKKSYFHFVGFQHLLYYSKDLRLDQKQK